MSLLGRTRAWLRAVVLRRRLEREMDEEMAAHIAQAAERFMARGMSARDAHLAARREFGQVGVLQESARDARGGQWIDSVVSDVKYALRYFVRTPLMTMTIVLTLALGIGFSSAVFSVVTAILTRPAPGVPNDPALVKIRGISNTRPFARGVSYPELKSYAGLTDQFAAVVGYAASGVIVAPVDPTEGVLSARGYFVTPNYFATLGVQLAAGRGFSQSRFDELDPPELTAIVTHEFAVERFHEVSRAAGQPLKVNDVTVTIIGVAPEGFRGVIPSGEPRTLWFPLSSWSLVAQIGRGVFTRPNVEAFEAFARLRRGVSIAEALPAVRVVAARADADVKAIAPQLTRIATADVVRLRGRIEITGRYENELGPGALIFTTIAILILLVCTTTVNSLLVGAAVTRRYEIGVRLALGASRARVVRQLLTEIAMPAIAGGALGLYVFSTLVRLTEIAKDGFDVSPNWTTTGFTLLYALLTSALCGLSPALHATRADVGSVLKDNATVATRRSRLQRTLAVAQIAIAQPLMVGLAVTLAHLGREDRLAHNTAVRERIVMANFDIYAGFNPRQPDKIPGVMERIAGLPGVVAVVRDPPSGGGLMELSLPSSSGDTTAVPTQAMVSGGSPGYFRATSIPLLLGRDFIPSDTGAAVTPLVISNQVATALFGSRNPVGQRLIGVERAGEQRTELEVVGVVRMGRDNSVQEYEMDVPAAFVPLRRERGGLLLIRTSEAADPMIPAIVAAAREVAPTLPLYRIRSLAAHDRERGHEMRQATAIGAGAGTVALFLACVGLYAMLTVAVGQRRREIGIRVALGAHAREVVGMFFKSGVRATLIGLLLGLPLSVAALSVLLQQMQVSRDILPMVAMVVALAVLGVASFASWLPARRAATVDPMIALRSE